MRQSKLFTKTLKQPPRGAELASHKLLVRAGYINQLTSGVWSLLPLGFLVHQKIAQIIREEMLKLGAQEVFLPALQPKEIWQKSGRWDKMDPPLFRLKDRHGRTLALGSTHEEVITSLAKAYIKSWRDLPQAIFQIQTKFRNEMRSTGGLLRTREFVMKDLYSFHSSLDSLNAYFEKVKQAYFSIFKKCGLEVLAVSASSGSIGGEESVEFMLPASSGEDTILVCPKCKWGTSLEKKEKTCPQCNVPLRSLRAIEVGHIFKLGTLYSEKMGANFLDKDGKLRPLFMGCYGIGVGRLMAAIVEISHDKDGIIWPESISPFDFHLLCLDIQEDKVRKFAELAYRTLEGEGIPVLFDDRQLSPAVKLKDADLIGIPHRLIISKKTLPRLEHKRRGEKKASLISLDHIPKL